MRTSLNDIKEGEDFLLKKMSEQDSLVYQARLILNPVLRLQLAFQKKLYQLIYLRGRRELKKEITGIQNNFFNDPARKELQNRIQILFQKT